MKQLIRTALTTAAALSALQAASFAQQVYLNEIYASHSGTDLFEFIELKGPAGQSLDNHVVLIVEGDWSSTSNEGTLDRAWDLTGFSFDSNGYFVLGNTGVVAKDFDIGLQDRLENGTNTYYLVDAGTAGNVAALLAAVGTDVDPDLDGITTIPTLSTILDSVGLVDGGINQVPPAFPDVVYDGASIQGPDGVGTGAFLPGGIFRGLDAPAPWCPDFLDFNEPTNQFEPRTPKAQNSVCPSSASIINYCTAGTTTNGCNAVMGFLGTPSVTLGPGGFTVRTTALEGQKNSIIFYSIAGPNSVQWGTSTSFLCVKTPQQRTQSQNTGGTAGLCDGAVSLDFFAYTTSNPGALGMPFSAGDQAWFQCWFRDPPTPKTTMLSDGLEVTFLP